MDSVSVSALLGPQEDDEPDMATVEFFLRDGHGWVTSLRIGVEPGWAVWTCNKTSNKTSNTEAHSWLIS
jgi:hypothetical protein